MFMLTLADTTDLLAQTTDLVGGKAAPLTPQAGIGLIDRWLEPLQTAEITVDLSKALGEVADKLVQVKTLLQGRTPDADAVRTCLGELAELVSTLSPATGSEGEMPSLLEGLSAALRQAGETSKAD